MLGVQSAGVVIFIALVIWLGIGFVCSKVAVDKGRSAGGFFLLGLLFPVLTLIVLLVMQPPQYRPGDVVQVQTPVNLSDGTTLPKGYRTKVEGVDIIDNTRVLSVRDRSGVGRWIAARAVRLSR